MDNENDYDDLWNEDKKPISKWWLIPLILAIILPILFAYAIISGGNSQAKFYKETCPKLNASFMGETLGGKCFKEINGEIKFYVIRTINGINYLVETKY